MRFDAWQIFPIFGKFYINEGARLIGGMARTDIVTRQ